MSVEDEAREALDAYVPSPRTEPAFSRTWRALRALLDSRPKPCSNKRCRLHHAHSGPCWCLSATESRPVTAQPNERETRAEADRWYPASGLDARLDSNMAKRDAFMMGFRFAASPSPAALTQPEAVEWEYGCRSSVHRYNDRADRGGVPLPWGVEPAEHGETCPSPSLARRQKAGPWAALEVAVSVPTTRPDGSADHG